MTWVVSGQFQYFEKIQHGITAKCGHKEQQEHHSLAKLELSYMLIPAMHECTGDMNQVKLPCPRIFVVFFHIHVHHKNVPSHFLHTH